MDLAPMTAAQSLHVDRDSAFAGPSVHVGRDSAFAGPSPRLHHGAWVAARSAASGPSAPARVAAPVPDGEGAYRIACTTAAGAAIGGVTVRPSGREALWISHLEVAPPERGRGLGVRLLDAALKLGARAGRRTACLEADDDGSGRLLRWYRGLGFALAGRSPEGRPLLSTDIHRSIRIAARRLDLAREARRAFP